MTAHADVEIGAFEIVEADSPPVGYLGPLPGEVWIKVSEGAYIKGSDGHETFISTDDRPFIVVWLGVGKVHYRNAEVGDAATHWINVNDTWDWHIHFRRLWPEAHDVR